MKIDELFARTTLDEEAKTVWSRRDGKLSKRAVYPHDPFDIKSSRRFARPQEVVDDAR